MMNKSLQLTSEVEPLVATPQVGLLQRTCECGNHTMAFSLPGDYEIRCEFDARLKDELLTPAGFSEFRGTIHLKLHGGNTR